MIYFHQLHKCVFRKKNCKGERINKILGDLIVLNATKVSLNLIGPNIK